MTVRTIVILWLVLHVTSACCQPKDDSASIGGKIIWDIVVAADDGMMFLTTPYRMDATDHINLLRFGVATGTAVTLDRQLATSMQNISPSKSLDGFMNVARGYGELKYALYLPAALYIGGLFTGYDDIRVTGRQIFQALLYSGAVTQSLKWLVGRGRPDAYDDPLFFKPIDFKGAHDSRFSMPSGHATVAFAVSSVLSERIDNVYASIALYGLAGATAISRMYHNRHWFSDVFVAGVIGTATGLYVTRLEDAREAVWQKSELQVYPVPMGVGLTYRF